MISQPATQKMIQDILDGTTPVAKAATATNANYADSAGSANTATTATNANYATQAGNAATATDSEKLGGVLATNYAINTGTYSTMSVGKATNDGNGNNIADTYATKTVVENITPLTKRYLHNVIISTSTSKVKINITYFSDNGEEVTNIAGFIDTFKYGDNITLPASGFYVNNQIVYTVINWYKANNIFYFGVIIESNPTTPTSNQHLLFSDAVLSDSVIDLGS